MKRIALLFFTVMISLVMLSACRDASVPGSESGNHSSSSAHSASSNQSTSSKEEALAVLEAPNIAKIEIKSYELVEISSGENCIAFTMVFYNQSEEERSFNDIGNTTSGIFKVSQNGTALEPRNTDETQNIRIKIPPQNGIEVVKAYKYLNTTENIEIALKAEDGTVYASYSLALHD